MTEIRALEKRSPSSKTGPKRERFADIRWVQAVPCFFAIHLTAAGGLNDLGSAALYHREPRVWTPEVADRLFPAHSVKDQVGLVGL